MSEIQKKNQKKNQEESCIVMNIHPVFSEVVGYLLHKDTCRLVSTNKDVKNMLHEKGLTVRRKLRL